jgi:hypothetical protein
MGCSKPSDHYNLISKFIYPSKRTEQMNVKMVARVCVEVDLVDGLPINSHCNVEMELYLVY